MAKDIKTKEVIKDIKIVDQKRNLQHFEKKQDISDKAKINKDEANSNQQTTPKNYAINKTTHTEKQTVINAGIEVKRLINLKMKTKKQKEKQLQSRPVRSVRRGGFCACKGYGMGMDGGCS